ncbi:MAG: mRNA surveillance protein pelota [Candidatus Micrarchaeota archaeon]
MNMRVIRSNREEGYLKLKPESVEDLWYLSRIIAVGDELEGMTQRRYRPPGAKEDAGEKKAVRMRLKVEGVEFAEAANKIRVTGVIISGSPEEYVQTGSHHTIDVEPHFDVKLYKQLDYAERKVLEDAVKRSRHVKGLIVLVDEQQAVAIAVRATGARQAFEISNTASKRRSDEFEAKQTKFFGEVAEALAATECDAVVIAGPGFQKDALAKFIKAKLPALAGKILVEHASTTERNAVPELLKKDVIKKALGQLKLSEELRLLDAFKASLGKNDGKSTYGEKRVEKAVVEGAAETVMVLDEYLRKSQAARAMMQRAEDTGAEVIVFDSGDDAGREFAAFGIAAMLRYGKPGQF